MATGPPPPPPPPSPPPCSNQPAGRTPPPCPGHAAIPFIDNLPVQETCPSPEALHEDAPAAPALPVDNEPLFLLSDGQEDNPHVSDEKSVPVQETGPTPQEANGPQLTGQQDEAGTQMNQAAEDLLA